MNCAPDASATLARYFVYDAATVNGTAMADVAGRLAEAYTGSPGAKTTDRVAQGVLWSTLPATLPATFPRTIRFPFCGIGGTRCEVSIGCPFDPDRRS